MSDVVLVDKYLFTVKPAWQGARPEQRLLVKGDEVGDAFADSILGADRELERGRTLGAIGSSATLAAQEAGAVGIAGETAYNDDELMRMSVAELAGVVGQHPTELDRIIGLEARKGARARKGVLALHPDYRDSAGTDEE